MGGCNVQGWQACTIALFLIKACFFVAPIPLHISCDCFHARVVEPKSEHALRWSHLQRGGGDQEGYVRSNTEAVPITQFGLWAPGGSEERREHRQEVYRQRLRLIRH